MATIIILGNEGMLGSMLEQYFSTCTQHNIITTNRAYSSTANYYLDALDFEDDMSHIMFDLSEFKDEIYVINCIGIINRHDNTKNMIEINALFPHKLAQYCKENNLKLIHISTDCVFSGNEGLYSELSIPDAIDDYGKTKALGEVTKNAMTLRTSIVGFELKNKYSFLEWIMKNKDGRVNGYNYLLWNGMTTLELAKRISNIIDFGLYEEGLYNLYSDSHSKYKMISHISKIFDLNIKIDMVSSPKIYSKTLISNKSLNDKIMNEYSFVEQLKELKEFHDTYGYPI